MISTTNDEIVKRESSNKYSHEMRLIIDQYRYIKIQRKTMYLSPWPWGIQCNYRVCGAIPQSFMQRSFKMNFNISKLVYYGYSISSLGNECQHNDP